ncbi:MAG: hypothetical protein ACR2MS_12770 [Weeksellaceae bacterium]
MNEPGAIENLRTLRAEYIKVSREYDTRALLPIADFSEIDGSYTEDPEWIEADVAFEIGNFNFSEGYVKRLDSGNNVLNALIGHDVYRIDSVSLPSQSLVADYGGSWNGGKRPVYANNIGANNLYGIEFTAGKYIRGWFPTSSLTVGTDPVLAPYPPPDAGAQDFTLVFIMTLKNVHDPNFIFGVIDDDNGIFGTSLTVQDVNFAHEGQEVIDDPKPSLDTVMVAYKFDHASSFLYQDGIITDLPDAQPTFATPLQIGLSDDTNTEGEFYLHAMYFFDRSLTENELRAIQNYAHYTFGVRDPDWYNRLWTPQDIIDDIYAWYDPSDKDTVTLDGSGFITGITDKSLNARNLAKNGTGNIIYDQMNGLGCVRYPAAAVTLRHNAATNFKYTISALDDSMDSDDSYPWASFGTARYFGLAQSGATSTATSSEDLNATVMYAINGNVRNDILSRDSLQSLSNDGCVASLMFTFNSDWSYIDMFYYPNPAFYYNGKWAETIQLADPPSFEIAKKLEGYLAHKWGYTEKLPNNHPYKHYAPRKSDTAYPAAQYYDFYWTTQTIAQSRNTDVTDWVDVNHGKVLTTAAPTNAPPLAYLNPYPALDMNGVDHYMFTDDVDVAQAPNTTVNPSAKTAFTFVLSGTPTTGRFAGGWGNSANDMPLYHYNESTGSIAQHRNDAGTQRLSGGSPSFSGVGIHFLTITVIENEMKTFFDGVQIGTTQSLGSEPYTFDRFAIGALLRTGAYNYSNFNFHAVGIARGLKAEALAANPVLHFNDLLDEWRFNINPQASLIPQAPSFAGLDFAQIIPANVQSFTPEGYTLPDLEVYGDLISGGSFVGSVRPRLSNDGGFIGALHTGTEMLEISGLNIDVTSGLTFFCVRRDNSTTNFQGLARFQRPLLPDSNTNTVFEFYHAIGGQYSIINRFSGSRVAGATFYPNRMSYFAIGSDTPIESGVYVDGERDVTFGGNNPAPDDFVAAIQIAGYNKTKFVGNLETWGFYNGVLDSTQLEQLRDYLRTYFNNGQPF